jgi:hypothetical protein
MGRESTETKYMATNCEGGQSLSKVVRTDEEKEEYVAFLPSVLRLLVTANVVPSSPILVTLMMGAIHFLRNDCSYKSHAA